MNLQDLLKENPTAAAEHDLAIKAARDDGKREGVTEGKAEGAKQVNDRVAGAMKFVGNDAYGDAVSKLAMQVVSGEKEMSALDSTVTVLDAMKEKETSKKATDEGNSGDTLAPTTDHKAVDLAQEIAEDNIARAELGLAPLKMEV